jgi:hypothetical protein
METHIQRSILVDTFYSRRSQPLTLSCFCWAFSTFCPNSLHASGFNEPSVRLLLHIRTLAPPPGTRSSSRPCIYTARSSFRTGIWFIKSASFFYTDLVPSFLATFACSSPWGHQLLNFNEPSTRPPMHSDSQYLSHLFYPRRSFLLP